MKAPLSVSFGAWICNVLFSDDSAYERVCVCLLYSVEAIGSPLYKYKHFDLKIYLCAELRRLKLTQQTQTKLKSPD